VDFRNTLRTVVPTLEADVLRVLAPADKAFTGRDIARRAEGVSHEGVRQALARLVRQGVVESERAGNATLYRLNREHLAAPHIVALATLRQRLIEELRIAIAAWTIQPIVAAVFGSVARGEAAATSDIDLLIVRNPSTGIDDDDWREQVVALDARASMWTGNDTRTLEYDTLEFEEAVRVDSAARDAVRDGIVVGGSWPWPVQPPES
jgi:DNA-binding transcriptional ArsR family regulator